MQKKKTNPQRRTEGTKHFALKNSPSHKSASSYASSLLNTKGKNKVIQARESLNLSSTALTCQQKAAGRSTERSDIVFYLKLHAG